MIRNLVIGLGLGALLCSCNSGSTGGVSQTQTALQGNMPSANQISSGTSDINTGNLIIGKASIGDNSDMRSGLLQFMQAVDMPRMAYCHIRALIADANTTVSLATVTDARVTSGTYEVMRFDKFFAVGSDDGCSDGGGETTAFYARVDVAAWDANDGALTPPFDPESIANFYLMVQFSNDGTFADDSNISSKLGMVMATGISSASVPDAWTTSDFPSLPADLQDMEHFTFWFDMATLPGDGSDPNMPSEVMMHVDISETSKRKLLAFMKYASPSTGQGLAFDVRVAEGTGIWIGMITSGQSDPNVRDLGGPAYLVRDGGATDTAGFFLAPTPKTQLAEAWNATGIVTHDPSNQGTYSKPAGFDGWPGGNSATFTTAFGQGRSALFTSELASLPTVSTWFEGN